MKSPRPVFLYALGVLLLGLLASWIGLPQYEYTPEPQCHSGHHEVMYVPSYWSTIQIGTGYNKISVPVMHPAWCRKVWVCDLNCGTVDMGLPEASHTYDHKPVETTPVVDFRCKESAGGEWQAKREYEN